MYDNICDSILFVVACGFNYHDVMKWDVCVFFEVLNMISKKYKAEKGIKD
jgi:hypothetical protein